MIEISRHRKIPMDKCCRHPLVRSAAQSSSRPLVRMSPSESKEISMQKEGR